MLKLNVKNKRNGNMRIWLSLFLSTWMADLFSTHKMNSHEKLGNFLITNMSKRRNRYSNMRYQRQKKIWCEKKFPRSHADGRTDRKKKPLFICVHILCCQYVWHAKLFSEMLSVNFNLNLVFLSTGYSVTFTTKGSIACN